MKLRVSVLIVLVVSFLPLYVAAAAAPKSVQSLAELLATYLNQGGVLLGTIGLVVYFWGIATNILKFGENSADKFKLYFFWGIIVLFVMFSLPGIIGVLSNTLIGNINSVGSQGPAVGSGSGFCPVTGSC